MVEQEVELHDFLHSTADHSKRPATWLSRFTLMERAAGMRFVGRVNLRADPDFVALVRLTLTLSIVKIAWRRRQTAEWVCSTGGMILTGENCTVYYNINVICTPSDPNICSYYYFFLLFHYSMEKQRGLAFGFRKTATDVKKPDRQTDGRTDRRTERRTDRSTDRQTDTQI